jgi:23S rRNA pseudoU1915 N3-methylase RlmH
MGAIQSYQKVHFEDISSLCKNDSNHETIIISTLPENMQQCLIKNTLNINEEVDTINQLLRKNKKQKIIIYGKNYSDENIFKKYNQLKQLGFTNIYLYIGGIFEWLCLQDIYGSDIFPCIGSETDILKYK